MALLQAADKAFTMETRDTPPAHLLMRIESFSMLSKHEILKYESSEFEAGNYKWKLIIYPNECDKNGDHVAAYVSMVNTTSLPLDWEVNAIFNIFLLNQNLDNYLYFQGKIRRFNAMNSKWGYSKLISKYTLRDPANGYLVDDNCVFGAEVFVYKSQRVIERVSVLQGTVPRKHDFKITGFSKLEDIWISEEITAGRHQWKIELHPTGNLMAKDRSVSIFLQCIQSFAPHQKVMANYTICIKNKLHLPDRSKTSTNWFESSSNSWGWAEFIAIADMRDSNKGFVIDDCCFLEISISVQVEVAGNAPKIE